jgi:hypothetical protein
MGMLQEKLIGKLRVSTKNGNSSIVNWLGKLRVSNKIIGKLRVSTKNENFSRKIDWKTKSFD